MTKQAVAGRLLRAVTTVMLGLAVLGTGCRAINKAVAGHAMAEWPGYARYRAGVGTIDDQAIKEVEFEDTIWTQKVEVTYQRGLKNQGRYVIEQVNLLISHTEKYIGTEIACRPRIYLMRLDQVPNTLSCKFRLNYNSLSFPMFVEIDNESSEAILSRNPFYPYVLIHEIVELSLISDQQTPGLLLDVWWQGFGFPNHTRWFREGFANYAGLVADEITRADADLTTGELLLLGHRPIHERPFSSLSKMGRDLFTWDQFTGGKKGQDGYNASLGLFLLIRDRYGPQAIRQIVKGLEGRGYLDGQDLIKICNEALNVDIVKMVGDFDFPDTGMKTKPVTSAVAINKGLSVGSGLWVSSVEEDSLADQASIEESDVITRINDRPIRGHLDFEFAIVEALEQGRAKIIVVRGQDDKTVTMIFDKGD